MPETKEQTQDHTRLLGKGFPPFSELTKYGSSNFTHSYKSPHYKTLRNKFLTINEFGTEPKSKLQATIYGDPVYLESDSDVGGAFIVHNNQVFGSLALSEILIRTKNWFSSKYDSCGAVVAKYDSCGAVVAYKGKNILLQNGDEDHNDLVYAGLTDAPTTSFQCLIEMFGDKAISLLAAGAITLVDYTPDTRKQMTKSQSRAWGKYWNTSSAKNPNMPKTPLELLGFSPDNSGRARAWHRAGTCIFQHKGKMYLTGQDEGTYFGVELAGQPKTVQQAFTDLIPENVRKCKLPWQRQGEWFITPVAKPPQYWDKDVIACDESFADGLCLPRDQDGNEHRLVNCEEIIITKDGVFAKNGDMQHSDHQTVTFKGWVTFTKNTAIRAVSIEGVD